MKPVDDGLFAHIKESLTEHEEAYSPGAWERFEKKDKKKPVWLWVTSLSSVAAVLLIGITLFYTGDKTQNNGQQQVKNTEPEPHTEATADVASIIRKAPTVRENLKTNIAENKSVVTQATRSRVTNSPVMVSVQMPVNLSGNDLAGVQPKVSPAKGVIVNTDVVVTADKNDLSVVAEPSNGVAKVNASRKDSVKVNKTRSFQEFLDAEVKSNSAMAALKSSAKKVDKWEMGVMVAPSVGNTKKLNMGYGLSMGYALSNKVSISSGISYNEMAATKSVGGGGGAMDAPASMAMVSDTKSLKSVDANLVGIDIPLGIKYYVSKKFYTNVGISAFAVLNQKQQNNYVQGSVEYVASPEQLNSTAFKAVFQERAVSEPVPSGEIREDKYLGFYNISFGFKQQVSGSKAFSVEPFMKLPMKEFTKENLYLIGTGLRLKFDF
jgi:hypothetical protein